MSKVLFDSLAWMNKGAEEYVQDYLMCTDHEVTDFDSYEGLMKAVEEWIPETVEWEWEDFISQCEDETKNHCLVTGHFMSWMGPQAGGKVYKDLATAVRSIIMDDSHPVFSINDDGNLVLDETHHDAPVSGNHYEFLILTASGERYYANHYNDDRRTLCENLKLNGKTRKVNTKIFGL